MYVHPVSAALVLSLLSYVGWLGLRMRTERRERERIALLHARLAPWAYALVLASWLGGVVSTWSLRSDLDLAASFHFRLGGLIALLLSVSAYSSYRMRRGRPEWRSWHPWFGAAAVLAAAAHVVAGLRIMP